MLCIRSDSQVSGRCFDQGDCVLRLKDRVHTLREAFELLEGIFFVLQQLSRTLGKCKLWAHRASDQLSFFLKLCPRCQQESIQRPQLFGQQTSVRTAGTDLTSHRKQNNYSHSSFTADWMFATSSPNICHDASGRHSLGWSDGFMITWNGDVSAFMGD